MTEKRCYTVKELQEILGISRPTVYNLLKKNEFRWMGKITIDYLWKKCKLRGELMEWKETTFEEDYQDAVAAIEANSQYGRLPAREKKYMTAYITGEGDEISENERTKFWKMYKKYGNREKY